MSKETKWMLGGVVIAAIGFFIPLYFQKIWLALFLGLFVGIAFLISLVISGRKEFGQKKFYWVVYGIASVVVLFNVIGFFHDFGRRDFQTDLLLEIRKTIDEGITKSDVQEEMVYVFGQYYKKERESVLETYRELMPGRLGEDGIFMSAFDRMKDEHMYGINKNPKGDNVNFFYEIDEEQDELKVIVVTDVSLGEDPNYENYDGQTGRFEMMYTLNQEGVHYEIRN